MAFTDWLAMARASNLPTVVTNALVGAAVGGISLGALAGGGAACLMYVGGSWLNDAMDATRDAALAPGRPIPSGRVSRFRVTLLGVLALAAGLALAFATSLAAGVVASGLAVAILLYDALHHRTPAATLLMGACRTLVYVLTAVSAGGTDILQDPTLWIVGGGTGLMIVALTIAARGEHGSDRSTPVACAFVTLPVIVAAGALGVIVGPQSLTLLLAAGPFLLFAWSHLGAARFACAPSPNRRAAVMMWLASMALADATFLAILAEIEFAAIALVLFAATRGLHRLVSGT